MNDLCYMPIPVELESPKSLLMRMAHYNGFGSVMKMSTYLKVNPRHWIDLLDQKSELQEIIRKKSPLLAVDFHKSFYTISTDKEHFVKIDGIALPRGSCPNNFRYCPQCILESHSLIIHDIADIGLCLLHECELIEACPKCGATEYWYSAKLFQCKCGFDRLTAPRVSRTLVPPVADPFQFPDFIRELSFSYAIAKLCASLFEVRQPPTNFVTYPLPLQLIDRIDEVIVVQIKRYPGFIRSLHCAPWINQGSNSIGWLADRALAQHFTGCRPCPTADCCHLAQVSLELAKLAVFSGVKVATHAIWNHGLIDCGTQPKDKALRPYCQIIREANTRYLQNFKPPSNDLDGLTRDEVALLLKCSLVAVDELRSKGWLEPISRTILSQFRLNNVYSRASVEQFDRLYVLIKKLNPSLHAPTHTLPQGINLSSGEIFCRRNEPMTTVTNM